MTPLLTNNPILSGNFSFSFSYDDNQYYMFESKKIYTASFLFSQSLLSNWLSFYGNGVGGANFAVSENTGNITTSFGAEFELGNEARSIRFYNNNDTGSGNIFGVQINSMTNTDIIQIRQSMSQTQTTNNVPEPTSITLLGLGALLGFAASRRKTKV